jgi:hypothetical protein
MIIQKYGTTAQKPQPTLSLSWKSWISKSIMFMHLNVFSLKMPLHWL